VRDIWPNNEEHILYCDLQGVRKWLPYVKLIYKVKKGNMLRRLTAWISNLLSKQWAHVGLSEYLIHLVRLDVDIVEVYVSSKQ